MTLNKGIVWGIYRTTCTRNLFTFNEAPEVGFRDECTVLFEFLHLSVHLAGTTTPADTPPSALPPPIITTFRRSLTFT